ncbi:MAG: iron chelate uptake ABC transporter family permease subunit [Deltaproteobacteria bacterium]|nr:iron chelate uptake ABC transporter family permease subunit [Deltaproteobacteria bacterium]
MTANARHARLLALGISTLGVLAVGLALLVRIPPDGDFGFSFARHGPHLLLAVAVGVGFGVSGVVQASRDPAGRAHPLLLAASTGAAFGAMRVADLLGDGSGASLVAGGIVGALLFVALIEGASRLPGARRLVTGVLLLGMLGLGVLAAIEAKGDPTGVRPIVFWLLGDLSRARWATALPIALVIAGLAIHLLRSLGAQPAEGLEEPVRRGLEARAALLFGLCLGAAGLISFFALIVAVVARWLIRGSGLRPWAAVAAALGAFAMVAADALPQALFGGLAPPLGASIALVAVPWFLSRNDGRSSVPVRAVEILLGLTLAIGIGLFVFVLRQLAIFIA